jgi:hypothetical protein
MDETIYTAPTTDTLSLVFPAHGGRSIYTESFTNQSAVRRELTWGAAGWHSTSLPGFDDSTWSGTSWSLFGFTHDADSVVHPRRAGFGGLGGPAAMNFPISLGTRFSFGRSLGQFAGPSMPAPNLASGKRTAVTDSLGQFVNYVDSQVPGDQIVAGSFNAASLHTHPSPMHDRVFVVVNYHSYHHSGFSGWIPCLDAKPIGTEWSCQHRQGQGSAGSTRTEVWSTAWTGGPPQLLWTRPNQTISWLGLAEQSILGRQEAVIGIGHSNDLPFGGAPGTFTSCAVEYVNILTGATLRAPRPADPRLTCQFGASELGTMAPAPALIGPSGH